jgi:hypothetical protein
VSQPRASTLEVQFNRGLRQDLEENLMPPGALSKADDVELDKLGRLQKRDCFAALGTTSLATAAAAFVGPAKRFAEGPNGEQIVFTDENAHLYFPGADKMREAGQWHVESPMRANLEEKFTIGADQAGQYVAADACALGNWLVIGYVQLVATNTYEVRVDVIDKDTKAKAISGTISGIFVGSAPNKFAGIRVLATDAVTAAIIWANGVNISATFITATATSVSTIPAPSVLAGDSDNVQPIFDAAVTSVGFVVTYRKLVAGNHTVMTKTFQFNGGAPLATFDMQHLGAAFTATAVAVLGARNAGEKIFILAANTTNGAIEETCTAFDLSAPDQVAGGRAYATWSGYTAGDVWQMVLGRMDATHAAFLFSTVQTYLTQTWPPAGALPEGPRGPIFISKLSDTPNVGGALAQITSPFANYFLASKFYTDARGNMYAWARFNVHDQAQSHYLLLDFEGNADQAFCRPTPVMHVANGLVQTVAVAVNAPVPLFGFADIGGGEFLFVAPVNLGASILTGQQIGCWHGQTLGPKRFLSTNAHGNLFVGGGTPLAYDGQRFAEMSFYSYPEASTPTIAGVGALSAGTYQYRFVYEWTDATGNRHQSPASPAVSVVNAGVQSVALQASTIHATRKQVEPNNTLGVVRDDFAPIRVVAYRTAANGTTFNRLSFEMKNQLGDSAAAYLSHVSIVTMTDIESDAAIAVNETLYVSGGGRGELSANCPPPCLFMAVHAGRLWGLDSEDPERIWCTKTFEPGEAASYNPGLEVFVSGCGQVNGLGGQDDKLYGLCSGGTYVASFGPGPDNTGQGSFPDPVLITTAAGCDDPRSVLTSTNGIYFSGAGRWGTDIFLLRRGDGNPDSIGIRCRDELSVTPQVRGVSERIDKGRIEFLFAASDDGSGASALLYYHYDLVDEQNIGQWTKAIFSAGTVPIECLGIWDGLTVLGVSSLVPQFPVVRQTGLAIVSGHSLPGTDIGNPIQFHVITGDIRPFGIAGYGDVHSLTLVGTGRTRAGFVEISASYDSRISFLESMGTNTPELNGLPIMRKWETATKKLPLSSVAYSFRENLTTEGGQIYTDGPILHGFSLETMPIEGPARLGAGQRGNQAPLVVPIAVVAGAHTGTGATFTASGVPTAFGSGSATVTVAGPPGTGKFSWSYLGQTGTNQVRVAGDNIIGTTGVSLQFAGLFVLADTYAWSGV